MKIYLKSFVLFVLISFLSIFSIGALYFIYTQARDAVINNFENKLAGIGKTVSSFVNLNEVKSVLEIEALEEAESEAESEAEEEEEEEIDWEGCPLYMKYHKVLAEIIEKAGASYLYIFNYGGEDDIVYLIDGASFEDDTRSAPNETEESEVEDLYIGLYNSFRGEDGVSPLFEDPDFGYMISGTYPILEGEEKRSFYLTGVDITLNEIVQTLTSLITKSIFLFIAILFVIIFLARIFSNRISKKVEKVKNETLKLSAIETHILDTKGTPKELLPIVKQISQYAKDSSESLNKMKEKRADILEQKLSEELKDYFKDTADLEEETIVENSPFYNCVFNFNGNIYAYSFLSSKDNAEDILKGNAIKYILKTKDNAPALLSDTLESLSIFNKDAKLIYSKNDEISIDKKDKNTLVYFNNEFKIFSL